MKTSALVIFCALTASLAVTPAVAGTSPWAKQPAMPSTMYVRGGSAPVDQALATIIPSPYQIALDESVPKSAVLVWPDGANWMDVLKSAVAPLGLKVRPDWAHNVIRIVHPHRYARPLYANESTPSPSRPRSMPASAVTTGGPRQMSAIPATARSLNTSRAHHTQAVPSVAPKPPASKPPKALGYTIAAGSRLSEGLSKYVKRYGWSLRWHIDEDYMLDASLPIPPGTMQHGMRYIMHAYQTQGGLMDAVVVFAEPNKIVLVKPAQAKESH